MFLDHLLRQKCPDDVRSRLWSTKILDALRTRSKSAFQEFDLIMEDVKNFPINYNHYYTDTINNRRDERQRTLLGDALEAATERTITEDQGDEYRIIVRDIQK